MTTMKATQILTRSSRILLRRSAIRTPSTPCLYKPTTIIHSHVSPRQQAFSTTSSTHKGLQPDTSDPKTPNTSSQSSTSYSSQPADLQDSEYHEIADQYLNTLLLKLEEKAEDPKAGFEVEYSAGVLTLSTPKGTYVINKQPPNKQIWLSSPVSGPKRYDWVLASEGQDQKGATEIALGDDGVAGGGKWVYLRDGAALTELVKDEIGVEVASKGESDATPGMEGPAKSG